MSLPRPVRIFLLEDDPVYGMMLRKAIEEASDRFDVSLFQHGSELLENLHCNPDIVSLDYHLPDMNGVEIL